MGWQVVTLPLLVVTALAGAGLYLLLTAVGRASAARQRAAGTALLAVAVIALGWRLFATADWWRSGSWFASLTLVLLACLAVAASLSCITTVQPKACLAGFGTVIVATVLLLVLEAANIAALASLLVLGGGLALAAKRYGMFDEDAGPASAALPEGAPETVGSESEAAVAKHPSTAHLRAGTNEPLLACLAGGLLAAVLVGTFHTAVAATPVDGRRHAKQLMLDRLERYRRSAARMDKSERDASGSSIVGRHKTALLFVAALMPAALAGIGAAAGGSRDDSAHS